MVRRFESVEDLLSGVVGPKRAHNLALLAQQIGNHKSEFQAYAALFAAFHVAYCEAAPSLEASFPKTREFEFEVDRMGLRRAYGNDGVEYLEPPAGHDAPVWDGSGVPAWRVTRGTRQRDDSHAWGFRRRAGSWRYCYRDEVDHLLTYALMRQAQARGSSERPARDLGRADNGAVLLSSAIGANLEPGMYVALAEVVHGENVELVSAVAAGALWLKGCKDLAIDSLCAAASPGIAELCDAMRADASRSLIKGLLRQIALP